MHPTLPTKTVLAHLPALLAAVVAAFVLRAVLETSLETNALMTRTHETIANANAFMRAVVDAETGQRGFIITGREEFLAPYEHGVIDATRIAEKSRATLVDAPEQVAHVDAAERLFRRWITENGELNIAERRLGTPEHIAHVAARVSSGHGKALIDAIRTEIDALIALEQRRLATRNEESRAAARTALTVVVAVPLVTLLVTMVLSLTVTLRAARAVRRLAESADRISAGQLEERALESGRDEVGSLARNFNAMAERLLSRARQQDALADLSQVLQASLNTDEACSVFARLAPRLVGMRDGSVAVFNPSRNLVAPVATWGGGTAGAGEPFAPEECWALRRGKPHVFARPVDLRCTHLGPQGSVSVACIPMSAQGDTVGVLVLQSDRLAPLPPETLEVAQAIGERFALTIGNLRLRDKLRDQSIRDPLTGLFNRRYMEETFERELHRATRTGKPLGVMVLDVDHFKKLNDTHGHEAGDATLVELGRLLSTSFRASDVPCRFGGEEFVVILPDAPLERVVARAEAIRAAFANLRPTNGGVEIGPVTLSIGVAVHPAHGATSTGLLKSADTALYRSKREGRNRVSVAEALPVVVVESAGA